MKKLLFVALCCLCLCGCGKKQEDTTNYQENLSQEQIEEKLMEANNWLTKIWNDGLCEISHYLDDGTSSIGGVVDIEFVVKELNQNYKDKDDYINFIDSLNEDNYSLIKESFSKAIDQANIVIEKVNISLPVSNTQPEYITNIDLFNQYQSVFYDEVTKLYYAS